MGARIDTQRTLFRGLRFELPHALDVDERAPEREGSRTNVLEFLFFSYAEPLPIITV